MSSVVEAKDDRLQVRLNAEANAALGEAFVKYQKTVG